MLKTELSKPVEFIQEETEPEKDEGIEHGAIKMAFLQIDICQNPKEEDHALTTPGISEKQGNAPPPRSLYFALLERQEWPEGVDDVVRRIKENSAMPLHERKQLLEYTADLHKQLAAVHSG